MNEACKLGLQEILAAFDDNSLFALATTVTQGLLKNKIRTRQDAISAIFNYSPDALSILRRRIITREALFLYANQKSIPIKLPATKSDLIEKVAQFWNIHYTKEILPSPANTGTVETLAEQFTAWFYSMLNQNEVMGTEHFFPDSNFKITTSNCGQIVTDVIEGNREEIVQKLFATKSQHGLYFNPNLTKDGVQGRIDPHGLVMVLVCGTLHSSGACVGVFEQVFALVRDPSAENNWKIKNSELSLRGESGVTALPTLDNNLLT